MAYENDGQLLGTPGTTCLILFGPVIDILFGPDNRGGRRSEIAFLVFGPFTLIVPLDYSID